jgi:hypothetical protein
MNQGEREGWTLVSESARSLRANFSAEAANTSTTTMLGPHIFISFLRAMSGASPRKQEIAHPELPTHSWVPFPVIHVLHSIESLVQ